MARRDSWPSYARLRVSGFSANLNYRSSGRGETVRYNTHDGEYVRGLVCNIVDFFVSLGAFGITRDDVLGYTLELFFSEGDNGLSPYVSQSQQITPKNISHSLH